MADLYPSSSFHPTRYHPHHHHHDPDPFHHPLRHHSQSYFSPPESQSIYSPPLVPASHHQHSSSSSSPDDDLHSPSRSSSLDPHHAQHINSAGNKADVKPQATFLTKLYNLLERPENHHMIRWDQAGEHIIVERPEQLALHVLPSIYRQSRFASFSRQLNIYGFMRKVNLRNVDPGIDDPDASTWSHPTLNRHSPPEVVANFKRRVPPRLPKPRKRDGSESVSSSISQQPRSAISNGAAVLPVPSNASLDQKPGMAGRARGYSVPDSFSPSTGSNGWSGTYPRSTLPPLTVPEPPMSQTGIYSNSHGLHPLTPTDSPSSAHYNHPLPSYPNSSNRNVIMGSGNYPYSDQNSWQSGQSANHSSGSLSSLLNPSSGNLTRPTPTVNTSYTSSISALPIPAEHSASSLSPDSRPTTSYSSSVSSLPYEDYHDYSRPNSSHHRSSSPRPTSSKGAYSSLSIRRTRRHSQAVNPYPNMYGEQDQVRPSTSSSIDEDNQSSGLPRVRSMIQLPSVDQYHFNGAQAEFAYSAMSGADSSSMDVSHSTGWNHHRSIRPSTSTSSIASHASSSQAPTPDSYATAGETSIHRFSPDYGYVPLNEHLPPQYTKPVGEL